MNEAQQADEKAKAEADAEGAKADGSADGKKEEVKAEAEEPMAEVVESNVKKKKGLLRRIFRI